MDLLALTRIIDRVERGTTTPTDASALRAIFQPCFSPATAKSQREEAHHGDVLSPRIGSQATVALTFVRDRYPRGEFQIQTSYRLLDGSVSTDESRRVYFSGQYAALIRELWDVAFDETARVLQNEPAGVRLAVNCPDLEAFWSERVRTIAVIIGYELHVVVAGVAPEKVAIQ